MKLKSSQRETEVVKRKLAKKIRWHQSGSVYLRVFFFICVVSFLFACFLFYLRVFFFICVFSFLFACFLFYLRVFFFVCVVSFLFAWFLLCLQRVPCRPSYISIGSNRNQKELCSLILLTFDR